jgi:hypothetical protein
MSRHDRRPLVGRVEEEQIRFSSMDTSTASSVQVYTKGYRRRRADLIQTPRPFLRLGLSKGTCRRRADPIRHPPFLRLLAWSTMQCVEVKRILIWTSTASSLHMHQRTVKSGISIQ